MLFPLKVPLRPSLTFYKQGPTQNPQERDKQKPRPKQMFPSFPPSQFVFQQHINHPQEKKKKIHKKLKGTKSKNQSINKSTISLPPLPPSLLLPPATARNPKNNKKSVLNPHPPKAPLLVSTTTTTTIRTSEKTIMMRLCNDKEKREREKDRDKKQSFPPACLPTPPDDWWKKRERERETVSEKRRPMQNTISEVGLKKRKFV